MFSMDFKECIYEFRQSFTRIIEKKGEKGKRIKPLRPQFNIYILIMVRFEFMFSFLSIIP